MQENARYLYQTFFEIHPIFRLRQRLKFLAYVSNGYLKTGIRSIMCHLDTQNGLQPFIYMAWSQKNIPK